jgi:Na+/melibiose symporter-like transporter
VRRTAPFIFLLAALSALSGFLLSKLSVTGRAGINLFYKEYQFLEPWWQGALVLFAILLIFLLLQGFAERKLSKHKASFLQTIMILLALAGLYFTYSDFRHSTTHRLLGKRFHTGAYLFWIDWIIISMFYLTQKKPEPIET